MAVSHQIHTYTELRQQIRDLLRIQHPEWVQPNGESPMCDSIGRLFSRPEPGSSLHPEGGMILRRSVVRSLRIVYRPLRMAMDAWPLGEARSNPFQLINRDGTPSSKYAEVQQVNADVRSIGWYLLRANTAIYESGNLSAGGTPPPASGLVRLLSGTHVTIGVFSTEALPNSSSATRFLVMLASRDANGTVSAKVRFSAVSVQKLDKATGAWNSVGSDSGIGPTVETEVMLAPGDAELFSAFAL